jgi:ABC-type cobalamin/Fe3+-siderophores transport system ATPase subunit
MAQTLIECAQARVEYRGGAGLGPVDLRIEQGDFWGVVGPNGAGKSTLLRLLAAQIAPSSGALKWAEIDTAFMLQHHDYSVELPFRVRDVVGFGAIRFRKYGFMPGRAERDLVDNALRDLGLLELRDRLYRELSGGEQRKVQFARLAAQGAHLLLLDEPTAGLDLDWQERVTGLAADFHQRRQRTLVMVTHDVDRLPDCCNKVLLLKDGNVLGLGAPAEVFLPEILSELYSCRVEVVRRGGRYHAFSAERGTGGPD